MNVFYAQAERNLELVELLNRSYPDFYTDWKITITYYASLHFIKAKAFNKSINLGNSHKTIFFNLSNEKGALMPLDKEVLDIYLNLFSDSQYSRYNGHSDSAQYQDDLKNRFRYAPMMCQMIKDKLFPQ